MIKKIKRYFKKPEPVIWDLPVESKEKIDDKIADFLITQAEKALAHSLDVADKTTNRAYALIVLLVPLTSTAVSLLLKEAKTPLELHNGKMVTLFEFLTLLCVSALALLLTVVLPRLTMNAGREPKNIAHDHMLQNQNTPQRNLLLIKLNEIKNLQYKISFNDRLNGQRINRFKAAMLIICTGFMIGAIAYTMLE